MDNIVHLDFETYSEVDLRKCGAHRYARHESTEVLICCYSLSDSDDVDVWLPWRDEIPRELCYYVKNRCAMSAHNAMFERLIWGYCLRRMYPLAVPPVRDSAWRCTAAKAAASGLPRSLDKALAAAGSTVTKDPEGAAFIKTFCKPRKPTKKDPRTRILPQDDMRFEKGIQYCIQDVRAEKVLDALVPDLIPLQQRAYQLDIKMNDRGLPIDLPLVYKASAVVQGLEADISRKVQALTGGVKATQVAKMIEVFEHMGLDIDNMQAETVRQALKTVDPESDVYKLLELRIEAGRASTKKLISMITCADPRDHVVQGGFLLYGAHTGRYAGRLVQPHNYIRGRLSKSERDAVFWMLDNCSSDDFITMYGGAPVHDTSGNVIATGPIDVVSQCMRGFIKAPEGLEIAVVDYTAIEARVLAWVAGEETMLEAYRSGVDVYKLMAVMLFKLASINDVSDEQRRIAKNLVLGCGYQLGGVKFVDYCAKAGLVIDPEFAMSAVKLYRKGVPAIVASWTRVERLISLAITNPGREYDGLKCTFFMREHWLCIGLPSGREMRYPYATATLGERWGKPAHLISFSTEINGRFVRENTYGGKLIENIVQAIAYDVMQVGMTNAEASGYPVIGTIHDEILSLVEVGTTDVKHLEKTVCTMPPWADGMPLSAKGFSCIRYEKG